MSGIYTLQTENELTLCSPPQWVWSLGEQCGWGSTPRPSLRALIRASWPTWVGCWSAWRWAWWCYRTTSRGCSSRPCSGSSSASTPYLFSALSSGTFLLTAYLTYDCPRLHELLIMGKAIYFTPFTADLLNTWPPGQTWKWLQVLRLSPAISSSLSAV